MAFLKLPAGADAIFSQYSNFPRSNSKLLIYTLPGIAQHKDLEELCNTATAFFLANEGEGDDPAITFLTPAPPTRLSPGDSIQEILEAHVASLTNPSIIEGNVLVSQSDAETICPFAFIVVEDPNWRTNGVTVIFCYDDVDGNYNYDSDDDGPEDGSTWRVDECEVSLPALVGVCRDLALDREEWHTIENCCGRPTRRTGSERYLASRSGAWTLGNVSGEMAHFSDSKWF